jgi:ribosome biogenesis GTPase
MVAGPLEALVVRVDARRCEVRLASGATQSATLRGRLFEERGNDRSPLAVGDRVRLEEESGGLAIAAILPRRNLFCRRGSGEDLDERQVLAANVDQVIVVSSLAQPTFSSMAADRILVACSFAGLPARLVLNKADLDGAVEEVRATYVVAGVPLHLTSALRGDGVEELRALTAGQLSVFYGVSGVGKSSLLNALVPELAIATRESSEALGSGRHTTTFSRLHELPGGGAIVDTPGVRKFRPYGLPPSELRLHYPELRGVAAQCRFADCTHRSEPGCALLKAVAEGRLPVPRLRSYLEILAELEAIHGGTGGTPPPQPDRKTRR